MGKWLTGTFAVLFVGTGIYAYRQYQENQKLLLKTDTQYQRAFHSLSSHVDLLQDQLGKSLAVNTTKNASVSLADTWRIAYTAQTDLAQLPLTGVNLSKTQDFLHNVGQLAYELSLHPKPGDKALTDSDWNSLHALYDQSSNVEQELRGVQAKVLDQRLRFIDAENALNTKNKDDNQIIDGFQTLEKKVSQFSEVQSDTMDALKTRNQFDVSSVPGNNVTSSQVADKVASFLGRSSKDGIRVERNGPGARFPSYTVIVTDANQSPIHLGVLEKGGHILWMSQELPISSEKLDLEQGQAKAQAWADSHGFKGMKVISSDQYDHSAIYHLVCEKQNITYYPCSITVRVALDNGKVTAFNAQDYVLHHKQHQTQAVTLTRQQALAKVNPHVQVEDAHIAQILDDNQKPVTVWEVLGTLDRNTYKVYVNAVTGVEERVEKLRQEGIDVGEDVKLQEEAGQSKPAST